METLIWNEDIKIFYVTADSFPDGIAAAHEKLHSLVPPTPERKYFGVSRPENGPIVYRAGAQELHEGEAEKFNCNSLVLKKGEYVNITISNYHLDVTLIGKAFQKLLALPHLDPQGYCVEWYTGDREVKCMIRLR